MLVVVAEVVVASFINPNIILLGIFPACIAAIEERTQLKNNPFKLMVAAVISLESNND